MTTPPEDGPTTLLDARYERGAEAAELARRFPGVAVWFGAATRRWWALVPSAGRWRLVEAGGTRDLSRLIDSAKADSPGNPNAHASRPPKSRRCSSGRHARAR